MVEPPVGDSLAAMLGSGHHVVRCATVDEALERLPGSRLDVVIVDMVPPGDPGLRGLERVLSHAPEVPVVAVARGDGTGRMEEALTLGAHDATMRDALTPDGLRWMVRAAYVRTRVGSRVADLSARAENSRELDRLRALGAPQEQAPISAQLLSAGSLRRTEPGLFAELAHEYGDLVRASLRAQQIEGETAVDGRARQLADRLGRLGAGPRDVVEVHRAALEELLEGRTRGESQALRREGRFTCLQLMGHLVSFYRLYSISPVGPAAHQGEPA